MRKNWVVSSAWLKIFVGSTFFKIGMCLKYAKICTAQKFPTILYIAYFALRFISPQAKIFMKFYLNLNFTYWLITFPTKLFV